ncbi:MAG TPA: helix-turn-helix transcriptional regulator, partial [Stellaceae bacterium]|nr:helix-turn-helix transcriptional regulator [Stellaceae bacterium]
PRPAISLDEMGVERWQHDFWHLIIQSELWDGKARPDFSILPSFNRPAASRYAATTPHLLRWFKAYNEGKLRAKQVWPFNFMLAFQAKRLMEWEPEKEVAPRSRNRLPDLPRAVAPYHKDISVAARNCFDRETDARIPPEQLKTFLDALGRYDLHPEPKFLFGDYRDRGATKRRHVVVTEVRNIGKEANRWEEQFYLGAEPEAQIVYGSAPQEERQVCARLQEAMERHRVTAIAEASGLSRKHIYAIAKRKTRPSAEALNKLNRALDQLS